MSKRGSQAGLAEAFLHPLVGRNVRLEAISQRIDWRPVEVALAGLRSGERGAPPYPALMMTKALLLQQWYGLSDPGLEEALLDRMSFRRFVVLEAVNGQLDAQGLIVRQGTLIDASLVAAQSQPPRPAAKDDVEPGASRLVRSAREPDADWTKRGAARFFGYKAHVAVDRGSGLVRRVIFTPASVNDTVVGDDLVLGDEGEVWAAKAYDSHARRARLAAAGIKNRICRRGNKHHRPSIWSQRRNHAIARVRGRVETLFAVLKRHYRHHRARYLTLERNRTDLLMACLAITLRRALVL